MKEYIVKCDVEYNMGILGASDEDIQMALHVMRSSNDPGEKINVSNVREKDKVISYVAEITVEATNEQEAIVTAKSYIENQLDLPDTKKVFKLSNFRV